MRDTSNDFVISAAVELASLSSLTRTRASALMGIEDSYIAWCVDEAMMWFGILRKSGKQLRPKDTEDNIALLKEMGAWED